MSEDSKYAVEKASGRKTMRPEMRPEDARARAEARAAEIRGNRGNMDDGIDEFYVDSKNIPDGWSYEWKRHTLLGKKTLLTKFSWLVVVGNQFQQIVILT